MILDATVDPDRGRLHVACDAAGFLGELGTGRHARVAVVPRGGQTPVTKARSLSFATTWATASCRLATCRRVTMKCRPFC